MSSDTIAAIATPMGRGGVGVIRISGPACGEIAQAMIKTLPAPRQAALRSFYGINGDVIDQGVVLYYPDPHSFTGEAVIELQGHGGPVVMQMVLETVLHHGARLASPGEFTQRAFLNGKLDLVQAEAVADLINASTKEAALGATRSLQGEFSKRIIGLSQEMIQLRVLVEAGIDFSEEEIDILHDAGLLERIEKLIKLLENLLIQAKQGKLLKEGFSIAIVGQPNAGKSSLLNYLTQEDTAIVTPIPGTTRDLVKATIQWEGVPIHLVDTAGIREQAGAIEQEGILRAKEQQKIVDKIILLIDATHAVFSSIEEEIVNNFGEKVLIVFNKIDLLKMNQPVHKKEHFCISAKTGEGVALLLAHLKQCMQGEGVGVESSVFISRQRHVSAIQEVFFHVKMAKEQLVQYRAFELAAEELRYAQAALGSIVGKVSSDELLGEIFSQFCIGK